MERGKVIHLGHHRLMCGDALNPDHIDRLLDGAKPDMLYCDPPYGMGMSHWDFQERKTRRIGKGKSTKHDLDVVLSDAPFDPSALIVRFDDVQEQFWWGADYYRRALPDGGAWIVWDKRCNESADRMFGSTFELCWSRQPHRRDIIRLQWAGLFGRWNDVGGDAPRWRRCHPTQKPTSLAEWFIGHYSKENAIIADFFAGSGSTLLACERLNRRSLAMELSPDYCDTIIRRYEKVMMQPRLMEIAE